jgi:apolipoprotein D and lipocalin family protein
MVVGPTTDYLWILARAPQLDAKTLETLVARAKAANFPVETLVYVDQSPRAVR